MFLIIEFHFYLFILLFLRGIIDVSKAMFRLSRQNPIDKYASLSKLHNNYVLLSLRSNSLLCDSLHSNYLLINPNKTSLMIQWFFSNDWNKRSKYFLFEDFNIFNFYNQINPLIHILLNKKFFFKLNYESMSTFVHDIR